MALLLPSVCGFLWNRVPFLLFLLGVVSSHLIHLGMHINMRVCVCARMYYFCFT